MTLLFLSLLALFGAIALGQLLWAFKASPTERDSSSDHHQLLNWYQTQLQELTRQRQQQEISARLYEQNTLALQRELLQTTASTKPMTATPLITTPYAWLLALCLLAASMGLYWSQESASQLINHYQSARKTAQAEQFLTTLGGTNKVIAALQAQLTTHPDDPRGWYLLGRLYFSANQFPAAIKALQRANTLLPQQTDTELSLAEAYTLNHQADNALAAEQLLQQILQREPQNPGALNLQALIAYQAHRYQQAIDIWQKLWVQVPPNSDTAKALASAIDKARTDQRRATP